jgi:dipeptidyl-peptidase-4
VWIGFVSAIRCVAAAARRAAGQARGDLARFRAVGTKQSTATETADGSHRDPIAPFLRMYSRTQRFTLGVPRQFGIAPDGSRVLFLRSTSGIEARMSLWSLDVDSGRETRLVDPADLLDGSEQLSPEERAARERTRTQTAGIVSYTTDDAFAAAVFSLSGKLFAVDLADGTVRELPATTPVIDPRVDPTGQRVAYVSGGALRVIELDGTGDRVLAEPDDPKNVTWGLADFIAAEEMDRHRGYWWSPDGTRLLAARADQTGVRRWYIADPVHPDQPPHEVAYPAAGTDNAVVGLAVVGLDGTHIDVEWDATELPYLATVHWSAGGPPLIAVQTRDQTRVVVRSVDIATGATETRQELTDPHWVDIVAGVPSWTTDGRLLTIGARDGAYRLLADGEPITGTDVNVRSVLDATADDVLCTGWGDDPTQIHVYTATYAAGAWTVTRLSDVDGVHHAVRSGETMVCTSAGLAHDGTLVTVSRNGKPVAEIESFALRAPIELNLTMLTVGERGLRCALLLPENHQPGDAKLPVVLDPYGGPHAQRVLSARGAYLMSQFWANQGFAVLVVDGRGTPGRGPAWDRAIADDFVGPTVADQVDAVHAVAEAHPDLDTARVGIRGWSFGGYLAAAAVLRRPDAVHAAIAGAPVTDWRLYDTHYTERYLGHPDENPEVYERNSLLSGTDGPHRPIMLIHGLADDNVFAAHSLQLSAALMARCHDHVVVPLSGVTHMSSTNEEQDAYFMLTQLDWMRKALSGA